MLTRQDSGTLCERVDYVIASNFRCIQLVAWIANSALLGLLCKLLSSGSNWQLLRAGQPELQSRCLAMKTIGGLRLSPLVIPSSLGSMLVLLGFLFLIEGVHGLAWSSLSKSHRPS